jgi:addiction module RelE/StbE family toxin
MEKEIVWTETAQNQLEDIYFYLLEITKSDSLPEKIVETIYNSVSILKSNSEIYEWDEMKQPRTKDYRAYEIYNYRVSYKITDNFIFILRIRHTSRNPKKL